MEFKSDGWSRFERAVDAAVKSEPKSKTPSATKHASASPKKRGDDLAAVTGTSLDKGVELDALAKTN
jgi:hypothetical protein